jgi:hypothetical protein
MWAARSERPERPASTTLRRWMAPATMTAWSRSLLPRAQPARWLAASRMSQRRSMTQPALTTGLRLNPTGPMTSRRWPTGRWREQLELPVPPESPGLAEPDGPEPCPQLVRVPARSLVAGSAGWGGRRSSASGLRLRSRVHMSSRGSAPEPRRCTCSLPAPDDRPHRPSPVRFPRATRRLRRPVGHDGRLASHPRRTGSARWR